MVGEGAQLYTIEGVAAAMIMLLTAYFVVNATAVYTAGDTHINDMQLEILGKGVLDMMDTRPNGTVEKSPLRLIIEEDRGDDFRDAFVAMINNRTVADADRINFAARYYYHNRATVAPNDPVESYPLSSSRDLTGGEHAVRATKWVIVTKELPADSGFLKDRAVLVEVLVWRD